jgi:hypothetical protein
MSRGGPVRRTRDVRIRLTPAEHTRWRAARDQSGRRELGAWARAVIEEILTGRRQPRRPGDLPRIVVPEANAAAARHLVGVANNVNQIARWCNTEKRAPDAEILARLVAEIRTAVVSLRTTTTTTATPAGHVDQAPEDAT